MAESPRRAANTRQKLLNRWAGEALREKEYSLLAEVLQLGGVISEETLRKQLLTALLKPEEDELFKLLEEINTNDESRNVYQRVCSPILAEKLVSELLSTFGSELFENNPSHRDTVIERCRNLGVSVTQEQLAAALEQLQPPRFAISTTACDAAIFFLEKLRKHPKAFDFATQLLERVVEAQFIRTDDNCSQVLSAFSRILVAATAIDLRVAVPKSMLVRLFSIVGNARCVELTDFLIREVFSSGSRVTSIDPKEFSKMVLQKLWSDIIPTQHFDCPTITRIFLDSLKLATYSYNELIAVLRESSKGRLTTARTVAMHLDILFDLLPKHGFDYLRLWKLTDADIQRLEDLVRTLRPEYQDLFKKLLTISRTIDRGILETTQMTMILGDPTTSWHASVRHKL